MSRQAFEDARDADKRDCLDRQGGTPSNRRGEADDEARNGNKQKQSAGVKFELTDFEADENQPSFCRSAQQKLGQQAERGTNDEIREGFPKGRGADERNKQKAQTCRNRKRKEMKTYKNTSTIGFGEKQMD